MAYNITWYGRGGQGLVIAAQILAEASFVEGFKGVTSAPQFGPERRGAPLTASTRIDSKKIRTVSQIVEPDFAIFLDTSLLTVFNAKKIFKKGTTLLINSSRNPKDFAELKAYKVAVCDANNISKSVNLVKDGKLITNSPMLGAFAKVSGVISLNSLKKVLAGRFKDAPYKTNLMALESAYEKTII